jgi:hypothetical protein
MPTSVERLAQQLETLRSRVDRGLRTPQLIYSSIDNGSLPVKDENGQTTVIIGQQFDGTAGAITVAGPNPPIPSAPTAEPVPGGINITWDGTFEDPQPAYTSPVVAPMTFNGVVVEVADNPSFAITSGGTVNRGVIPQASGGDRSVAWPTGGITLYVRLRTRDLSGKLSDPSISISVTSGQVQLGDLGFDIYSIAGNSIYYTTDGNPPATPTDGFKVGDLWLKKIATSAGGGNQPPSGTPLYQTYRWLGAAWVLLENQAVSQAIADALAAQTTANSATSLANAAQTTANGKITSWYQISAPTSGMSTGDFWVDTDDGNKLYRYSGSAWVLTQDTAIQTALTNAGTAQATADRKIRIWAQTTAPTAEDVGDLWIDVDDGNKLYTWGPTTTIKRTNWITNPAFEYNTTITSPAAPTGYAVTTGGTVGTTTTSTDTSGAVGGTRRWKIVGSTLSTLNTAWIGVQQTIAASPGDLLSCQVWLTYAVVSASQRPEWMIEWLNAAGAVISTLTDTTATTMGTAGSRSPYSYTTTAAPALTVSARVTIRRRGTLTTGGSNVTNADLAVDAMIVERNRASGAPTTYFDGNTTGTDFLWNGTAVISTSSGWFQGSGANAWQAQTLRTGAFEPQSVLASNVIATGSITAALLEANMILTTTIIAGPSTGDHAVMSPTGFRVYANDPIDGVPNEVIRMGTDTNDFFGVVNGSGTLVASIDDAGGVHGSRGDFEADVTLGGKSVALMISESQQPVGSFRGTLPPSGGGSFYGPIGAGTANRVGLAEVNGMLISGQRYRIDWQCVWTNVTAWDEAVFSIHPKATTTSGSSTAPAPLVTDTTTEQWLDFLSSAGNRWKTAQGSTEYTAAISGRHRFLLALRGGDSNAGAIHGISDSRFPVSMSINPLGPAKPNTGQFSQGGGTFSGGTPPAAPPTPTQQYDTGWMSPAGWRTFNGSGTERFDTAGPVQGWDPSGFNGDGKGYWWWSLPSISGTVDEVWVWLYSSHWYYNSGGTARLWPINAAAGSPGPTGPYDVGGWPKPGSVQVNISGWAAYFHNNQGTNRAIGVQVGPGGSTNLTYYGRFDGPSARLLIRYTQ